MLNYGYAPHEAECLRAINTAGLDAHVGFLHEMNPSKYSLAYDLQEPFRFVVELTVLNLIEKDVMDKQDFIRTEDYDLRFKPTGARKLISEFNVMLNRGLTYKDKNSSWSSILLLKTREMAFILLAGGRTWSL